MVTRREFLESIASGAAGMAITSTAKSYGQILGSNDRLHFAIVGLRWRGYAHLSALMGNKDTARVSHICDVDDKIRAKFAGIAEHELGYSPASEKDFRHVLEQKEVDVVTIATPDHWHTPLAIAALQAGKHVYVEKPCSHNPAEGALLVQAQQKYQKHVQQGTQQRSCVRTIEAIDKIHNGLIGTPYFAKGWYSNSRKSIGTGKEVPVPPELDWDIWQGPAPRKPYMDNVHPYNWHWFKHWGTGEALNNGTHSIDLCRWALGVDYPNSVIATGGRYQFKDDWQFYDTLVTNFDYGDKLISWEGRSCSSIKYLGHDTGLAVTGTNGSVFIYGDGGSGYEVYDPKGATLGVFKDDATQFYDKFDGDVATVAHFANLIAAIRKGDKLHAPISQGNIVVTMLQLSNISWELKRELRLNPKDGRVQNDPKAMAHWSREYEHGWAPHL
ncbi:MAG: Gfo/Idh/MocA family oxidoreductase [Acidobacteria bacterium]|nr:Gfo/Idh/MocA family oxidoreductase [Acidobacteriota bacterium]